MSCPCEAACASRVHSHYIRKLTDLPSGGQRVCLHDTLFSFFFVVLLKNFPLKNRKRLLCFGLCTLRWIRRINWFSSSQTCCERAPENSSTTGFHQSEPARSASCRGLF